MLITITMQTMRTSITFLGVFCFFCLFGVTGLLHLLWFHHLFTQYINTGPTHPRQQLSGVL